MNEHLYIIAEALYVIHKGNKEKARQWLNTPLRDLGLTPYQLIDNGAAHVVIPYLMNTYKK